MIRPSTPRTVIVLSGDEELWVNTGDDSTRYPYDKGVRPVKLLELHATIREQVEWWVGALAQAGPVPADIWATNPQLRAWVTAAHEAGLDGDQLLADAIEGATEDRRAA